MNKKFELTDETTLFLGTTLFRIRALKDFGDVKKGDAGGFIESEDNLSQQGMCWIYGDAAVCEGAIVMNDAMVRGSALVEGNDIIKDGAFLQENAIIGGCTIIERDAVVRHDAHIIDGKITKITDYFVIGNIGSRYDTTTFYKNNHNEIVVSVGCFSGSIEEFKKQVKATHKNNKHAQIYLKVCDLAEIQLSNRE